MKIRIPSIPIILTVLFFGLLPRAQAVNPPPDGAYPGGNTAEGQAALLSLTTGGFNTANGWLSLRALTTGNFNTGVGAGTLALNTADENTATGTAALLFNTTGFQNTANGAFALFSNTTGANNTAIGLNALQNNITGVNNTAVGFGALGTNNTGNGNTALGAAALGLNTGTNNTAVGVVAGLGVATASDVICIGTTGADVSNSCFIGHIFGSTSSNGIGVLVNTNGKLGTMTSSKRFKENIEAMDKASDGLFALKPVRFHYKKEIDPAGTKQLGLVAEDVEKVNPDLVVRDKEGKPYSVRYDQVNAMLLNEFLKEHRKVEEQQAAIAQLKSELQAVSAQQQGEIQSLRDELKEQAAQIQKVSGQTEMNKNTLLTVADNL